MIRRLLLCMGVILGPLPALALSCLEPSVTRSFAEHSAAAERYVIVHGRLTFDAADMPKDAKGNTRPPEKTLIAARMAGMTLGLSGFKTPFEREITLDVACFGPWCGRVENGGDVLAFVAQTPGGYVLAINPCGGSVFGTPSKAVLRKVTACFQQGACAAE